MISREEARAILKEMHDYMHDGYMTNLVHGGKQDVTMEGDIEALSVAIEALSQPPADQWIPCSERLPEKSGAYIVSVDYDGIPNVWKMYFTTVEYPRWITFHKVTAWMPLPEPYKGVKQMGNKKTITLPAEFELEKLLNLAAYDYCVEHFGLKGREGGACGEYECDDCWKEALGLNENTKR